MIKLLKQTKQERKANMKNLFAHLYPASRGSFLAWLLAFAKLFAG